VTEQQIVNGIKNGDRRAMRAMYDLLVGHAMATAMRYLADRDECRAVLNYFKDQPWNINFNAGLRLTLH